jgi:hypothetical protein
MGWLGAIRTYSVHRLDTAPDLGHGVLDMGVRLDPVDTPGLGLVGRTDGDCFGTCIYGLKQFDRLVFDENRYKKIFWSPCPGYNIAPSYAAFLYSPFPTSEQGGRFPAILIAI